MFPCGVAGACFWALSVPPVSHGGRGVVGASQSANTHSPVTEATPAFTFPQFWRRKFSTYFSEYACGCLVDLAGVRACQGVGPTRLNTGLPAARHVDSLTVAGVCAVQSTAARQQWVDIRGCACVSWASAQSRVRASTVLSADRCIPASSVPRGCARARHAVMVSVIGTGACAA